MHRITPRHARRVSLYAQQREIDGCQDLTIIIVNFSINFRTTLDTILCRGQSSFLADAPGTAPGEWQPPAPRGELRTPGRDRSGLTSDAPIMRRTARASYCPRESAVGEGGAR